MGSRRRHAGRGRDGSPRARQQRGESADELGYGDGVWGATHDEDFTVVAEGETAGTPWRLEAKLRRPHDLLPADIELRPEFLREIDIPDSRHIRLRHPQGRPSNSSGWPFRRGRVLMARHDYFYLPDGSVSPQFVIGFVARGMPGLRFDAESGASYRATMFDLPDDDQSQPFMVEAADPGKGLIVATDRHGNVVDEQIVHSAGRWIPRDWREPAMRVDAETESGPIRLEAWHVPDGLTIALRHPENDTGKRYVLSHGRRPDSVTFHTADVHNPDPPRRRPAVLFGDAGSDVVTVTLDDPAAGATYSALLHTIPDTDLQAFVIPHDVRDGGVVIAHDAHGKELMRHPIGTTDRQPRGSTERASGELPQDLVWTLIADSFNEMVMVRLRGSAFEELASFAARPEAGAPNVQYCGHVLARDGSHFACGLVSKDVVGLRTRLDDGREVPLELIEAVDLPVNLFVAVARSPRWVTWVEAYDGSGKVITGSGEWTPTRAMRDARGRRAA